MSILSDITYVRADFSVSRSLFVCVCVGSSEKSERNADCDLFHDLSKNGFS